MFNQGRVQLVQGEQDVEVSFPSSFTSAPQVVIPVISNTSADPEKFLITPHLVGITNTGFTVRLDTAPNTGNYYLSYVAGTYDVVFQVVAWQRKRITELPREETAPGPDDLIPMTDTYPVPHTVARSFSAISALFPRIATVPGAPNTSGSVHNIAVSGTHLYVHNGTRWGRIPLRDQDWGIGDPLTVEQSAVTDLEVGVQTVTIAFDTPFSGTPQINFNFMNTSPGNKLVLSAILTEVTGTQFTLALNTPPPDGNYKCVWTAKSIS